MRRDERQQPLLGRVGAVGVRGLRRRVIDRLGARWPPSGPARAEGRGPIMRDRKHRLFAAVYDAMSRPLEQAALAERRARLLGDLTGDLLEVGAGTGVNLRHYQRAARVVAVEPDLAMRRRLAANLFGAVVPVQVSDAVAESLPHPDD